jgi:hypothetical protein
VPLDCHKVIDIHLKLPMAVRRREFPDAESDEMLELRAKILAMGLHELVTEAGNAIYTGQFLRSSEVKPLFKRLDEYAGRFGGILEMCVEPCIFFWRKESVGPDGGRELAVVPRILVPDRKQRTRPTRARSHRRPSVAGRLPAMPISTVSSHVGVRVLDRFGLLHRGTVALVEHRRYDSFMA